MTPKANSNLTLAQLIGVAFDLCEALLDHVADRDDAHELALVHRRQVSDATVGHDRHDLGHAVVALTFA